MTEHNDTNDTPQEPGTKDRDTKLRLAAVAGQAVSNPNASSLAEMLDPILTVQCNYDTEALNTFLDVVFHAGLAPDEYIATWAKNPKKSRGYAITDDALMQYLSKPGFDQPRKLYFATSTLRKDDKGHLRHKNANFYSARVLVLDDIGTKVPYTKLPKNFDPTYIIESSPGSFQYGYVYKDPIADLDLATLMVQLVYEAGYSDTGGKLAVKQVRLPGGINGKPGPKGTFTPELVVSDGPLWTPQDIVSRLDLGVTWDDIQAGVDDLMRRRAAMNYGAALWSHATQPTFDGIIDPVLEWCIENGLYEGEDADGWVSVQCPNAAMHTDGDMSAGYSPVGRGDNPGIRGFNCFHDHCATLTTHTFLQYVAANGGPMLPVQDPAAHLTSEWVFDAAANAAWKIKDVVEPMSITMTAFPNLYPNRLKIILRDGKEKLVPEHKAWLESPSRVSVYGARFDPSTAARLVEHDGHKYVNLYIQPPWGTGPIDDTHVEKFKHFLEYLVPIDDEREYFLDWLSAKTQSMAFRGAAMLMIAKAFGTGRTTLADMVKTLFTESNVTNVPFKQLMGADPFNEWAEYPLMITDETMQAASHDRWGAYERLKEIIDPRPKLTTINPKYGVRRRVMVYSSCLMFSNHVGAIAAVGNDRRFYVVTNPSSPASPAYFTALNDWLGETDSRGEPVWAQHVWRWLRSRPVDVEALLAPPPMTVGKEAMLAATVSPVETAVTLILSAFPEPVIASVWVENIMQRLAIRLGLDDHPNWKRSMTHILRNRLEGYGRNTVVRYNNTTYRPQFITGRDGVAEAVLPVQYANATDKKKLQAFRETIRNQLCINGDALDNVYERVFSQLPTHDL